MMPRTGHAGESVGAARDASGIGGHPAGLTTLFFTEMWERFSYYGSRAILVFYMVAPVAAGGLGMDTARATAVYGAYTASVYLTALPGGWVADRFVGARAAVLYGGILIAAGNFLLAAGTTSLFYAGMVSIALGTGLLKPNVSSMVGALYDEGDPRRDGGFSIFYMGINLGAMASPLLCGYLGERIDWRLGFAAAGVGMAAGLVQYVWRRRLLFQAGAVRPGKRPSTAASSRLSSAEWGRLTAIGVLFLFSTLFWMAFEQAGSSLSLFARDMTENRILGYEFPASWYQSVNSIFIIALAPVFSWLWLKMGARQPSSPAKFSLGLLLVGLGFVVLVFPSALAGGTRVSPAWLVGVYLLHTAGELLLSPVGLSTVTRVAPARIVGFMMGLWFLSLSVGNFLGGWVAGFFDPAAPGAVARLFASVALTTVAAGSALALMTPWLRRLMGEAR